MKKFFFTAAIALMCVPAFISCKKDKGDPEQKNFFKIGDVEKVVNIAEFLESENVYDLYIEIEGAYTFRFLVDRNNKGKKIDLLQPDPLTKGWGFTCFKVEVHDSNLWSECSTIAYGDPLGEEQPKVGEGSFMQVDEKDGEIVLDFELKGCTFTVPFPADGATISGHQKGFKVIIPQ